MAVACRLFFQHIMMFLAYYDVQPTIWEKQMAIPNSQMVQIFQELALNFFLIKLLWLNIAHQFLSFSHKLRY